MHRIPRFVAVGVLAALLAPSSVVAQESNGEQVAPSASAESRRDQAADETPAAEAADADEDNEAPQGARRRGQGRGRGAGAPFSRGAPLPEGVVPPPVNRTTDLMLSEFPAQDPCI